MTTNQKVNKEAVRMLVADVGYTEAANQTGIDRNTLYQWNLRYGWDKPIIHSQQQSVRTVRSPSVAHAEIIQANGQETKLGLSEYAKRQAQHLATKGKLKDHGAFRNLASGSSTLHGWNENAGQAQFSLNVLNLGGNVQIGVRSDQPDTPEQQG